MLATTIGLACIQPGYVGYEWNSARTVYVYIDPSIDSNLAQGTGNTPRHMITAAVEAWANYMDGIAGVNIQFSSLPTGANVIFQAGDLGNTGVGASQPRKSGLITSQTITINNNLNNYISNTNQKMMDPNAAGYDSYMFKITLHEMGHIFGLDDVHEGSQQVASVMDQTINTNDLGQGIPLSLTQCDETDVWDDFANTAGGNGGSGCYRYVCPGNSVWDGADCYCMPTQPPPSPIIIDVDGNGYYLTDAASGVLFDIFGNGHPIQIGWTASGSTNAFLVLDRNGNGVIDNGTELFGSATPQPWSDTPNGFLALAQYDLPQNGGNGDGVIDSQDTIFNQLRLWVDANHNGVSEPGELFTLPSLGVRKISLQYHLSGKRDRFGNQFRYQARINDDGSRKCYDVIFVLLDQTGWLKEPPLLPASWR